VPEGSGALDPTGFRAAAGGWLAPALGGDWDAEAFRERFAAE
ncbi:dethiobiotin synthase, partial [Streptomyces sp. SR27]|nr:dethiobiotin synthase [Streptomyces sp. SR27]